MYVEPDRFFHLTYCTNIHPGNGWSEVYANLRRYVPALKDALINQRSTGFAPHKAFGIGLRLSGRESSELLQGDHLQQFQDFPGRIAISGRGELGIGRRRSLRG